MLGWAAVSDVDWGRLFHAYGVADDTPDHLRNLTSGDAALREDAVDHLDGAVLHQGTIYSVTPSAVRVVAGLLGEPVPRESLEAGAPTLRGALATMFKPSEDQPQALVALLSFMGGVGESLAWAGVPETAPQPGEDALDELFRDLREGDEGWSSELIGVLMAQAVLALRDMAPEVLVALLPFVADENADVRREALNAVARWGAVRSDGEAARAAVEAIEAGLERSGERDERAGLVLSLGRLGADVTRHLDDADEAVRACVALFIDHPRANSILIDALTDPDRVNAWFADRPAFFPMHVRFSLLDALMARRVAIEAMLPAALALIAGAGAMTADREWGPILRVAFPDAVFTPGVRPPLPERLTDAQRAVLQALVANEGLWDPRNGNAGLARMMVGLPDDREAVARYGRDAPSA